MLLKRLLVVGACVLVAVDARSRRRKIQQDQAKDNKDGKVLNQQPAQDYDYEPDYYGEYDYDNKETSKCYDL